MADVDVPLDTSEPWTASIDIFADKLKVTKNKVERTYYKAQLEQVKCFKEDEAFFSRRGLDLEAGNLGTATTNGWQPVVTLTTAMFFINVVIAASKGVACAMSNSIAIVGSMVDSLVEVGFILFVCVVDEIRHSRNPRPRVRGFSRLELLAFIVESFFVAWGCAQVILKAIMELNRDKKVEVDRSTVAIMVGMVITRLLLAVMCCTQKDASARVLAKDCRDDFIANGVVTICALVASKSKHVYVDPICACVLSVYAFARWFCRFWKYIKTMPEQAASPVFLNRVLKICLDYTHGMTTSDSLSAYPVNSAVQVQIHMVTNKQQNPETTHDVREQLRHNTEKLPLVDHALVHVDYEAKHRPENKQNVV